MTNFSEQIILIKETYTDDKELHTLLDEMQMDLEKYKFKLNTILQTLEHVKSYAIFMKEVAER